VGKRDKGHKETKKSKKDTKKLSPATFLAPPTTVEVIKKKRKEKTDEDES